LKYDNRSPLGWGDTADRGERGIGASPSHAFRPAAPPRRAAPVTLRRRNGEASFESHEV